MLRGMTDSERIFDELSRRDLRVAWLARQVGMTDDTLGRRIRRNNWSADELERVYAVLQLSPAQREQGVAA